MNELNTTLLLNMLGYTVGIALYFLLFIMVWRHRRKDTKIDFLLILTAILGLFWNAIELYVFIWKDFFQNPFSLWLMALAYSALGFLPSVVVHSAENDSKNSRVLTISAYLLSSFAALLHFYNVFYLENAPSSLALQILTFGSFAMLAGLLYFNYKQKLENKTVLVAALTIFAVSALHFSSKTEDLFWVFDLIAHQSSLPLVLAILIQNYRFAFADLFLKRAISLVLLALTAFLLFVFAVQPLDSLHHLHEANDPIAIGILLLFWIATALIYPFLHKISVILVDKILLKRVNYETLQKEILTEIETDETVEIVLQTVSNKLAKVLTAEQSDWQKVSESFGNLPTVEFTTEKAEIFIPTNEQPFYKFNFRNFLGGRKLLSEEVSMLEAISLITARRIDALRMTNERYEREIREREFTKLTSEAHLTALRSQINPHFLFNALTTIGYLIQTSPEKSFETLMKLTQLLRSVLKKNAEFCTLGDELRLIENYLDIEKARFEERLEVEIDVPKELEKLRVPTLILQPLVENAIKHGISKNKKGGTVKIKAKLENVKSEVLLNLSVFDSGSNKETSETENTNGIGLKNIRGRLESYYGEKARFEFNKNNFEGSLVNISIPVKTQTI